MAEVGVQPAERGLDPWRDDRIRRTWERDVLGSGFPWPGLGIVGPMVLGGLTGRRTC